MHACEAEEPALQRLQVGQAFEAGLAIVVVPPIARISSRTAPQSGLGAPRTFGSRIPGAAVYPQIDEQALAFPANMAVSLTFDNQDNGIPHNVAIQDANGQEVFKGDIFNGPEKRTYSVPAIPAGSYKFHCTVHPNMVGTISIQ